MDLKLKGLNLYEPTTPGHAASKLRTRPAVSHIDWTQTYCYTVHNTIII